MPTPTQDEIARSYRDLVQNTPPATWIVEMIEHYRQTGTYRPEDVRRLLGDPGKGLRLESNASTEAILASF
jgi:hypothetical protein